MNYRYILRRFAFSLLAGSTAAVFLGTMVHHVYAVDAKPLAAFCLPILAVLFTFTSLLYMRGRSLGRGKDQLRTLFAAERSMQATVWYLTGLVAGASLYGVLQDLRFTFDPAHPSVAGLWLLLFILPYALMQVGLLLFMRAAWIISPQFLRVLSPYEVWRRIAVEA